MENEAKKTYEVIISTTFRYRTTVEASSKKEAEDIATREIVEDSGIDVCDTDDIDTDVDAHLVENPKPSGLPTTVTVGRAEAGIGASTSVKEAADILSDWLSDAYGCFPRGFAYEYEADGGDVVISDIDWDVDGEDTGDE